MNIGIDCGDDAYSAVTFAKMDGDVAVILATLTGEPADAFIALLRVARAADDMTVPYGNHHPIVHQSCDLQDGTDESCPACRLMAALKEVEHLL